ncbi:MAG: tRNA pseudouridine(38-40) synthase TruA [Clostridia bacterium]|nr:tRNA pseudouridine(38-40) synthase TruA [Clostridia bacterium]
MRYVLKVAYDGTNYGGWQIQNNAPTVQQELTYAIEKTFGCRVNVTASGRTDSGVHAAGQVCHFDAHLTIPPERMAQALNTNLPADIAVLQSAAAPEGFDANRSAKQKTYCYRMYVSRCPHPLKERYSVCIPCMPDIAKMEIGAGIYCGEHDFKAYCASGSAVKTTVRTVYSCSVTLSESRDCPDITITVCGGGFLYNMVRTIAGTLLYLGEGRISLQDISRSLESGDRSLVGRTMPPKGLTLENVDYGVKIFG